VKNKTIAYAPKKKVGQVDAFVYAILRLVCLETSGDVSASNVILIQRESPIKKKTM